MKHTLFPVIICILMLSRGAVAVLLMAPRRRAARHIAGHERHARLRVAPQYMLDAAECALKQLCTARHKEVHRLRCRHLQMPQPEIF